MDVKREFGLLRTVSSRSSIFEMDDYENLTKLPNKPRLNHKRERSFDDRSLTELSLSLARGMEAYECSNYSPAGRSGLDDSPGSSPRTCFEPHPIFTEAWESLRRSLVFFREQPVGTIAAYDHSSEEVLNYDQVIIFKTILLSIKIKLLPLRNK